MLLNLLSKKSLQFQRTCINRIHIYIPRIRLKRFNLDNDIFPLDLAMVSLMISLFTRAEGKYLTMGCSNFFLILYS